MKPRNLKYYLRKIRSKLIFWVWCNDIRFLRSLREQEAHNCLNYFHAHGRLLDFGAGSGHQAKYFKSLGFDVDAIDLDTSNYRSLRDFEVTNYDGKNVPFPDNYFDVIFSSNVFLNL